MSAAGDRGSEGERSKHTPTPDDDRAFAELLTHLIRVGNQLALAPTVDELCRQAVQAGLTDLGFERMSIWLVDNERQLFQGTYGIDEHGQLRDERSQQRPLAEKRGELQLLESPQLLFKWSPVALFNEANEVVGTGELGLAALWNGEEVGGMIYTDNLFSQQPISEHRWRAFELYASTLGHLLSLKRTESALRNNEELLGQILEVLPVGVFVLSPEETVARFNRAGQEMWEFQAETLENWSPVASWVGERREVRKDEWAGSRALQHGESTLNQEVEITRKDGTRRVFLNSGVPLRNLHGDLAGAVVVSQDITESKRHAQQLEALADLGATLRPFSGKRSVLNALVSEMMQLLPTQGVAVVLGDEEGRFIFEAADGDLALLVGEVAPEGLFTGGINGDPSLCIVDADLDVPWRDCKKLERVPRYVVVASLVAQSAIVGAVLVGLAELPDSYTLSLVGALADVSAAAIQRGRLYDEVMTQAFRLQRVMESVNFGLVLLDPQRRIVLANQHGQANLGHLAQVAVGDELQELGGQRLSRFLTSHHNQSRMLEINTDGVIFEITTVPVGATGAEDGWLMVIHDVTRDRSIQASVQQHQRLAAVGQLAAGIAHDFNNIIAVILLYVQMLQRNTVLGESEQKRLNVIREQAQNASQLIRQIMDFSRQTVIERQAVDLQELIEESIALWKRTLPEAISFRLVSEIEGPTQIYANANSIQQALTNLAVNARDALPDGGTLTVRLRGLTAGADETPEGEAHEAEAPPVPGLRAGYWFEVCMIDDGEGIAPEHLPHIFDPFFTLKDVGKGTGLGLAQVYGIIQQHGGLVTAQSEAGAGTRISLFLPALQDDEHFAQEGDLREAPGEGTETILLVEDNAPAREATKAFLEMGGYRVFAAADGREGLDLFHRHGKTIQLVLSDLMMPQMGGVDLYRRIHNENPAVRAIIMTGYPLDDEHHRLAEQENVEWLQKPFAIKQLTATVRRVLDRAKRQSEEQEA